MDFIAGFVLGVIALSPVSLIALFVFALILSALIEGEELFLTTAVLTAIAVIAALPFGSAPYQWVVQNIHLVALYFAGYVATGGVWSVAKWFLFLRKVKAKLPEGTKRRPTNSFAAYNKAKITGWIAYWPLSITGTIVGDYILRAFKKVYEVLKSTYDRIGNAVFAGFEE